MSTFNIDLVKKTDVQSFWDANPCGKKFQSRQIGSPEFFEELEHHRYQLEPHILTLIPFEEFRGKNVLEVGCGLGSDAVQFARAGALYHGIDLTPTAVEMTRKRFEMEGLSGQLSVEDAEALPFPSDSFDCVYSHGVIHHTPNIEKAVHEIHRVLKPGGRAIVMVYHRHSLNYYLNILFLRRLGIFLLFVPGGLWLTHKMTGESKVLLEQHKAEFRMRGWNYLSAPVFLSRNTDGAGNPLSRVYSSSELKNLFGRFKNKKTVVRYLNKHRLPILSRFLPHFLDQWFGSIYGWHIYIFAEK